MYCYICSNKLKHSVVNTVIYCENDTLYKSTMSNHTYCITMYNNYSKKCVTCELFQNTMPASIIVEGCLTGQDLPAI